MPADPRSGAEGWGYGRAGVGSFSQVRTGRAGTEGQGCCSPGCVFLLGVSPGAVTRPCGVKQAVPVSLCCMGAPQGKVACMLMCYLSPLLLWGFSAVCQALVVPREVSGQEGETLSLHCWYARGYEGYNKYWCRGAARGSCHKVVETAGREVPRQHGRVSITDNHIFCVVLLTVEELSMEDAGSYWCGVERAGRDIMEPVTVRVRPGECWRRVGSGLCGAERFWEAAGSCREGTAMRGTAPQPCCSYHQLAPSVNQRQGWQVAGWCS